MQLPAPQVARAIVQRYARILHRYRDDLGERPMVLPNGHFFPDTFRGDLPSVGFLVSRMQAHAGMSDIPIRVALAGEEAEPKAGSSCASGACSVPQAPSGFARLVDEGDGWCIVVPPSELRHPTVLTTNLVRCMSFIFLVETQVEGDRIEPPVDVTADFIGVALGFGPLLLAGAHIYARGCGGPQVASITTVKLGELAVLVALFGALGKHSMAAVQKELETTQRAVLSEAEVLIRANRDLVERLAKQPESVELGRFELEEPSGFLSNLLRRLRSNRTSVALSDRDSDFDLAELESLMISMPPSSSAGRPRTTTEIRSRNGLLGSHTDLRELAEEALFATRKEPATENVR